MRPAPNLTVERYRLRSGPLATSRADGNNGALLIPHSGRQFAVMVSDGLGWDHVSISLPDRCPTWEEMCHFKDLFFGPDECVVQYHPPRADYRNAHEFCLHIWRPQGVDLPMPDPLMVAPAPRPSVLHRAVHHG